MDYLRQFARALEAEKRPASKSYPTNPSPSFSSLPLSVPAGEATWLGLKRAVDDLANRVSPDHDVIMFVSDVAIFEVEFLNPHSFIFRGLTFDGHLTNIVAHYSQVAARIIDRPRQSATRIVTRFTSIDSSPT